MSGPILRLRFGSTEILCLDPLNATNAQIDTDSNKYDTNVTITCDRGYQINGLAKDSTYCNVSEKWEPSLPPCDGNLHSIFRMTSNIHAQIAHLEMHLLNVRSLG